MKQLEEIDINGKKYDISKVICEGCDEEIDIKKEPYLCDHSTVVIVHPSGYSVTVSLPNDVTGYCNHYHLKCVEVIPYICKEEIKNVLDCVDRRKISEKLSEDIIAECESIKNKYFKEQENPDGPPNKIILSEILS